MKKLFLFAGGILLLFTGILGGCGDTQPVEPVVISEEVNWPIDDTTVYATITRPESGNNYPTIVFIAGSGPTDRDWNSPLLPGSNGSAALLAEELASRGYVTIRYDKRFTGDHAVENLAKLTGKISLQSHLDELQGAIELLAEMDYVDADKIFVLANSEGTIHTLNYYLQTEGNKLAGMILTGAPGQSMGDLMRTQIEGQMLEFPGKDEILKLYDEALSVFLTDGTMNPDDALPDGIKALLVSIANPVNMPFTKEIWTENNADYIGIINVPVLVIIGKKDTQVDWQVDGGKLQTAAEGNGNIEFSFPENANHVLKHEPKPKDEINPASPNYNEADAILDADTLEIIVQWLETNAK